MLRINILSKYSHNSYVHIDSYSHVLLITVPDIMSMALKACYNYVAILL